MKFNTGPEQYHGYLDAGLLLASRTPVILGLDVNAVSPLWLSKLPERAQGSANFLRGDLSDWMQGCRTGVLNMPCDAFTFPENPYARSDSDSLYQTTDVQEQRILLGAIVRDLDGHVTRSFGLPNVED